MHVDRIQVHQSRITTASTMTPLRKPLQIALGIQILAAAVTDCSAAEVLSISSTSSTIENLENRIESLEAQQFSPTTRMSALVRSTIGGVTYGGNQINKGSNSWGRGEGSLPLRNAFTLNYDLLLVVDTSTTGQDQLRTILRAANFGSSAFGVSGNPANPAPLTQLDEGFEDPRGPDRVAINRLFYSTPINRYTTLVVGPRVKQTETIPIWPTLYGRPGGEQLLRIFTQAGSTSTYTLPIGPGGGLLFKDRQTSTGWSAGLSYVAANGFRGNTETTDQDPGGIGTAGSAATALAQLSYTGPGWSISAAVAQNGTGVRQDGTSYWRRLQPQFCSKEDQARGCSKSGITRSISLAGYWQPAQSGWIPSISAGVGFNQANLNQSSIEINQQRLKTIRSNGWLVGFLWDNILGSGNQLGAAVGQPTYVTSTNNEAAQDGNYALELYFRIRATDHIFITPTVYYLSRPRGADTQAPGMPSSAYPSFDALGALVEFSLKI